MLIMSPVSECGLSSLKGICILVGSCPAMIVGRSSGNGGVLQVLFCIQYFGPGPTGSDWGTVTVFMGII